MAPFSSKIFRVPRPTVFLCAAAAKRLGSDPSCVYSKDETVWNRVTLELYGKNSSGTPRRQSFYGKDSPDVASTESLRQKLSGRRVDRVFTAKTLRTSRRQSL